MDYQNSLFQVSIDISTECQLRCIECSTSKGINRKGVVGWGKMHFTDFKRIVDNSPWIRRIELSNWGEILLNEDLVNIIEYAFHKNITLTCGNGSNFNFCSDEVLEAMVKFQFEYINISIDGATPKTYSIYRVGGDFDTVIRNIKKLNYYKLKHNSIYPKLSWQFIIFGHNEHEIPLVKDYCKELNMVFNPKLNYSKFSPVINHEFVSSKSGLGVSSREEYRTTYGSIYKVPCYQCFVSPQINWDGELLGCCINKWVSLGNVNNDNDIKVTLNSLKYRSLMNVLLGKSEADSNVPCYHCSNYQIIKSSPLNQDGLIEYSNYIPPALRI